MQGQVILSWPDVLAGAADPDDGRNLVIHEFAHQLDQARGRATGVPFLGDRRRYARWAAVMGQEFARLRARLRTELGAAWDYAYDSGRLADSVPNWWRQIMRGRCPLRSQCQAGAMPVDLGAIDGRAGPTRRRPGGKR